MVLKTERLHLSKAKVSDAKFFMLLMNNPNWIEFIGDRGISSEKIAAEYIENNIIDSYAKNSYGLYKMTIAKYGTPIGICGFVKREYLEFADMGFAILPEFEGQGFVFEAAKACLSYGLKTLKLNPILGNYYFKKYSFL